MSRHQEAFVCGRFQPPHREHLDYLLRAKERCEFLWVGIVRPGIEVVSTTAKGDPHRGDPAANPLTYFERVRIISAMMLDVGVSRASFACTPFPLDGPHELLPSFMSLAIPCYTTVCEAWNLDKKRELEAAGYSVEVLVTRGESRIQGSAIRRKIVAGEPGWQSDVPPATERAVVEWGLRERLIRLGLKA
jgi:nicotinamide mononucleotide adenylyltransferase